MPTTDAPTREQLEAQAATVAAQLDTYRRQDQQQEERRQRQRAQAERNFDERQVAAFSRRALDAEVDQARAVFLAALAETPIVQALADFATSLQRRRTEMSEYSSVLTRLGRPGIAGHDLPPAELGPIDDVLAAAVERLVTERTDADAAAASVAREEACTPEETP